MEISDSRQSSDALPSTKSNNTMVINNSEIGCTSVLPLRELQDEEQQLEDEGAFTGLPLPPPDNWKFNLFLANLADRITTDELEKLKFILGGHDFGGIGKRELEKIKTPLQLFTILKTRLFLTRDNMIYLQKFLLELQRMDLLKHAIEYAKSVENVLYFYPASEQPENGYKYIKVHVEGQNFRNCRRSYVQELRNRVAAILCIPAEFVLIAGIEPSSSLLITFMIPELYVDLLADMLDGAEYELDLQDLSIDIVEVNGKQYSLYGFPGADTTENDQHHRLETIYQQLERTCRQLEDSEIERLRVEEKSAKLEMEQFEMAAKLTALEKMFVSLNDGNEPASLASQSALQEFQKALRSPGIQACDKNVLQSLINANTMVVVSRMRDAQAIQQRKLQLEVEDLRSQLQPLNLEIEKYKFFSKVGVEEMDKKLLESFRKLFEMLQVKWEVQIAEPYLQILKRISRKLRQGDKDKLLHIYNWAPNEELKRMMDGDGSFFLAGILYKEIQKQEQLVDFDTFISQCLRDIGRTDLLKLLKQLISKTTAVPVRSSKKGPKKLAPKKSEKEDTDDSALIRRMAEQVQEMHDLIHQNSTAFAPESKLPGPPPPYSRQDMSYLATSSRHSNI